MFPARELLYYPMMTAIRKVIDHFYIYIVASHKLLKNVRLKIPIVGVRKMAVVELRKFQFNFRWQCLKFLVYLHAILNKYSWLCFAILFHCSI